MSEIILPIKIESQIKNPNVGGYTSQLTSLLYNFKTVIELKYKYDTSAEPGVLILEDTDKRDHIINFSTMGKLKFKRLIICSAPLNNYILTENDNDEGTSYVSEVIIELEKYADLTEKLYLFVPVKSTNGDGLKLFEEIKLPNAATSGMDYSGNDINLNSLIPTGPFLYCTNVNLRSLQGKIDDINTNQASCIFFHNFIKINTETQNRLFKFHSPLETNNYNKAPKNTDGSGQQSVLDLTTLANSQDYYYNQIGAKNTDMVYEDGLVPMECEPVEDLEGNPIFGNRFDWMKRNLDNLNQDTKNYLYVCLLILILSAILYFIWKTIFESVGKLNGPVHITKRIYSLS